ncbi:hypothetical protein FVAG_03043, partial [Fusobacterium varium ATCC 27725]
EEAEKTLEAQRKNSMQRYQRKKKEY